MSINSLPERSPLGVFYRSRLGVFGKNTKPKYEADGVGEAIGVLLRASPTSIPVNTNFRQWDNFNSPYGTAGVDNNTLSVTGVEGGKSYSRKRSGVETVRRIRGGWTYAIPLAIAGSSASFNIRINSYSNSLEAYNVSIYYAAPDVSSWPTGWWNTLSGLIATLPYGVTTFQNVSVPISIVTAHAGSNLVFIIGEDKELTSSGTGSAIGAGASAAFGTYGSTGSNIGPLIVT